MKKTRILALVCAMLLVFSFAYAEKPEADLTKLSTWEGTWLNYLSFLEKDEVKEEMEKLAKSHNKTVEEAVEGMLAMLQNDYAKMKIEGDNVSFLDAEDKEVAKNKYSFVSLVKDTFGDHEFEWALYTTEDKDAKYPALLMVAPHSDKEDSVVHFHVRYGKDQEELKGKQGWFPTFVKEDTTVETFMGELEGLFSGEH